MKKQPDLFILIKSMTQAEKAYFKKFSRRYGNTANLDYLSLFDAIDSQADYDEKKLKKRYQTEKWIHRLPVLKRYLTGAVLRALRNFRESHDDVDVNIAELLANARICFEKRLFALGNKFLEQARQLAIGEEMFSQVIEIDLMFANQLKTLPSSERARRRETLYEEIREMLRKQENFAELWRLGWITLDQQAADGVLRQQREAFVLEEVLSHPLLAAPQEASSFKAQIYIYNIKLICYHLLGNDEASFALQRELLAIYESTPALITRQTKDYLVALHNYLSNCLSFNILEEAPSLLNKLQHIPAKSESLRIAQFESYHLLALMYQCKKPDKDTGLRLIHDLDLGISKYKDKLQQRRLCGSVFYAANFLCCIGCYDQALAWISRYELEIDSGITPDLTAFMKLLYLISQYELGHYTHLEYMLRNAYYHLRSNERLYELEKSFLQLLRKLIAAPDEKSRLPHFAAFEAALASIIAQPLGQKAVNGYFDFSRWAAAKRLGKHS